MAMCEVLIGHLFYGHARRRKGETVEMTASHAGKAAKAGQVRILGGTAAPPSRGASEGGHGVDEVDGVETGEGAGPTHAGPTPRKKGGR